MGIYKDWKAYRKIAKMRKDIVYKKPTVKQTDSQFLHPRITDDNRIRVEIDSEISFIAIMLVVGVALSVFLAVLTVIQDRLSYIDYEKVYSFDPTETPVK
jgi:hypothetical protein